jgi:hypothetical protein
MGESFGAVLEIIPGFVELIFYRMRVVECSRAQAHLDRLSRRYQRCILADISR